MRKITCILLMFCFAISGAIAQEQVNISRFEGKKITGIEASGAFKITAKQGESTGVTVSIPARFEKQLELALSPDGTLLITMKGKINGKKSDKFTAEVTLSTLENIELTGASSLSLPETITTNHLTAKIVGASSLYTYNTIQIKQEIQLTLAGASTFSGEISVPNASFEVSGASKLKLEGKCTEAYVKLTGASRANLGSFIIDKAEIQASGASHINLQVLKELRAEASGASSITYSGDPKTTNRNATGASKIKKSN